MYVTEVSNKIKLYNYNKYNQNIKIFKKMFNFWANDILKINKQIIKYNSVFIFGAHIFSQMILCNGLNKKNLLGILDNDKNKINNFLYGTELKIFKPYYLKKFKKPCVILRAGSYNNEIKKQILHINPKTVII